MNLSEPHPTPAALNEYLDGALLPVEAAALQTHLEQCAPCAQRMAELRLVFTSLSDLPDPPLVVDLSARVTAQLRQAQARPLPVSPRVRGIARLVTTLQAVTAIVLLVIFWQIITPTLFFPAPLGLEPAWQAFTRPISDLLQPIFVQLLQAASRLPRWDSAAFPLLETLLLLAVFWLAGNGYLIFDTRHPRRKP